MENLTNLGFLEGVVRDDELVSMNTVIDVHLSEHVTVTEKLSAHITTSEREHNSRTSTHDRTSTH